jgi:hypothetical protein
MRSPIFFLLLLLAACHPSGSTENTLKDTTIVISADTIPETRTTVKAAPIAEYSEKIHDELNDWKFAVSVYETKRTFHYKLRIEAKEVRVNDSLNIPNFGIQPKLSIRKAKEPLACIIGFLDKKGDFKEYRKVSFQNDRLHISTLGSYAVAVYRMPVK